MTRLRAIVRAASIVIAVEENYKNLSFSAFVLLFFASPSNRTSVKREKRSVEKNYGTYRNFSNGKILLYIDINTVYTR
jgi:hypothetical protein